MKGLTILITVVFEKIHISLQFSWIPVGWTVSALRSEMLAPNCSPCKMYLLGLLLSFWQEGCLPDESAQKQKRWAHLDRKEQLWEQKTELPKLGADLTRVWSQHLPPSLSGHCDDGHTYFTGIWVTDLKKYNVETLIFTLCTKCKVMHFPPNEKQQPPQTKTHIRDWRTREIVKCVFAAATWRRHLS